VLVSFSSLGFLVSKFDGFMLTSAAPTFLAAALICFLVAFYALGFLGELDKGAIVDRFIRLRLLGAFLIGIVFGLVSTPCASAPLFAIISLASSSGYAGALGLIAAFAIGHFLLLLAAGVSVGFAQTIVSSRLISKISSALNRFFALLLIGFGIYFFAAHFLRKSHEKTTFIDPFCGIGDVCRRACLNTLQRRKGRYRQMLSVMLEVGSTHCKACVEDIFYRHRKRL
jgi:hypothetical protein